MKRIFAYITFAIFSVSSCSCEPNRKAPEPRPPVLTDTQYCEAACQNIGENGLNCEEGKPLKDGTTCAQLCKHLQDNGVWLQPACVMKVKSCDEIEQCELKKLHCLCL